MSKLSKKFAGRVEISLLYEFRSGGGNNPYFMSLNLAESLSNSSDAPTVRSGSPQMTTAASGSNDVDAAAEDEKEERVRQPAVVSRNGFDEDGKDGKLGQTLIEKDGGGSQEEGGGESDFTLMPTSSSAGKNRGGRIKRSPPAVDDGSLLLLLLLALHFCLRC